MVILERRNEIARPPMTTSARWRRLLTILFPCAAFIALVFTVFRHNALHGDQYDDAYITYRYAAHLAQGRGLVFNDGEHVNSASSLLYSLILAGCYSCGLRDLELVANGIGIIAGVTLLAVLGYDTARRTGSNLTTLGLLLPLSIGGSLAGWATSGMETTLFSCIVVCTIVCLCSNRLGMGTLLLCLAVLCRPEGAILLVCVAAAAALAGGVGSLAFVVPVAVGSAVQFGYFLFNWAYYGFWFPHSVAFKTASVIYHLGLPTSIHNTVRFFVGGYVLVSLGAALLGALTLLQAHRAWRNLLYAPTLLTLYCGISLLSIFMGPQANLCRYGVHLLGACVVATAILVQERSHWFSGTGARALFALLCIGSLGQAALEARRASEFFNWGAQHQIARKSLGRWLEAHASPEEWILSSDIGAISYEALNHRFIDATGLTSAAPVQAAQRNDWLFFVKDLVRKHPSLVADTRLPSGQLQALFFIEYPGNVFRAFQHTDAGVDLSSKLRPPLVELPTPGGYDFVIAPLEWR